MNAHSDKPSLDETDHASRARAIYLLPNVLTTAGLFCGFYAMIAAIQGKFEQAAMAVFLAMVFDGLDGRVARLTHTQSAFGVQYDSLADVIAFGVAPAVVVYLWALSGIEGRWGWIGAFVYVAGAALRLARFNVQVDTTDKNFFIGLASPAAAALLMGMVWVGVDSGWDAAGLAGWVWLVTVTGGLLMVSSLPYYSFKGFDLRRRVSYLSAPLVIVVFALAVHNFALTLWCISLVYALSAPAYMLIRRTRRLYRS
ncbi:MAG: CDP-diacylglycerol--serine O-phosphatidyltransferase [Halothiobacillaceae bacterium]